MYRPLRRRSRWGAPLNQALMGELAKANRLALNLFIQYQVVERTPRFFANITRKMKNRGMAPRLKRCKRNSAIRLARFLLEGRQPVSPNAVTCRQHARSAVPPCAATRWSGSMPARWNVSTAALSSGRKHKQSFLHNWLCHKNVINGT